ncbi:C-C motif chemokine 24 [Anabarilius grahami]|uniref:C-C motif chemokine 24 n=1 Tax=Anabarilius grahami TaxID=495550 RepID=A0A3N0XTA9_ANAGA|nr:C-C motif chemokine 24 [Anabarilius grahami]
MLPVVGGQHQSRKVEGCERSWRTTTSVFTDDVRVEGNAFNGSYRRRAYILNVFFDGLITEVAEWKMLCFPSVLLLWPQIFSTTAEIVKGSACLTTTDTKVPVRKVRSYSLQHEPLFPVDAVRFLTVKGNTICSDPSSLWAIKAMKYLDAKKKHAVTGSACLNTTDTKVPVKNLCSFSIQCKPLFPVDAVSSTTQIWSTPDTKQKTENKTEFPTARTTLEPDWRGSTETTEAWEEEEEDAVTGSACLNITDTKVPVKNLCSFSIQCKPLFPVDAVRFLTIKGNTICSDPSSSWAVKAMKHLDENMKPQSASSTDHQFVTTAPKNASTSNAKSAQR